LQLGRLGRCGLANGSGGCRTLLGAQHPARPGLGWGRGHGAAGGCDHPGLVAAAEYATGGSSAEG
jgi:hypothetical protein